MSLTPEEREHRQVIITLSLGAGVQSTVLALMACRGDLPKPDAAIFADRHDDALRQLPADRPVVTVTPAGGVL